MYRDLQTYSGVCAGFALIILLVAGSLVQFPPEAFGLPVSDGSFQAAVEASVVGGVQLQLPAEDAESLQGAFAGSGLHEVLKQLAGLRRTLIFRLPHLFPSVDKGFSQVLVGAGIPFQVWGKKRNRGFYLFLDWDGSPINFIICNPQSVCGGKKTSYIWVYRAVKWLKMVGSWHRLNSFIALGLWLQPVEAVCI